MNKEKNKSQKQQRRKARVRAKIFGTAQKPRLSVFKSLKHISAQLIDDEVGKTLVSANDKEISKATVNKYKTDKDEKNKKMTSRMIFAFEVGKLVAQKAIDKKIKTCVFDKSKYKYHGQVKAISEGARKAGLKF